MNGRRYAETGRRSWRRVAKYPRANAPARLTLKVAHGHSEASWGSASATSPRATAPMNPPAKMAAISRRSITGSAEPCPHGRAREDAAAAEDAQSRRATRGATDRGREAAPPQHRRPRAPQQAHG